MCILKILRYYKYIENYMHIYIYIYHWDVLQKLSVDSGLIRIYRLFTGNIILPQ